MNLTDLKNDPTNVRVSLQIRGMSGAAGVGETLNVDTRVVTPTTDTVERETIKFFSNAVAQGTLSVDGAQGTTQPLSVTAGGTANCYWLPWGSGKVYCGNLGNAHDYFCTWTINGCGVIIGGTAAAPFVAHANLESARLTAATDVAIAALNTPAFPAAMKKAGRAQALTYEKFYGSLAKVLIDDKGLPSDRPITILTPDTYLIRAGAGFGAVFGVKSATHNWTFYGNWGGKTQQIWPKSSI